MSEQLTPQPNKAGEVARQVLTMSRNTLLVNLRFLDMALSMLEFFPTDQTALATDGKYLLFEPKYVLKRYKAEKEAIVHDFLHMIFHCIFRHMYVHSLVDQQCWNLACDIAVEYSIHGLGLKSAKINREVLQESIFKELEKAGVMMTAEKLYRYFLDQSIPPEKLAEYRGAFLSDEHKIWYMSESQKEEAYGLFSESGKGKQNSSSSEGQGETITLEEINTVEIGPDGLPISQESQWADISEQLLVDMETFSKNQGDKAGNMLQNLKEVTREKYDYTEFLKKFAVMGEVMKINDDEFDYIFYTYGLKLYKKVPLVEPLEYKDVKRIKEFVIAIDTSCSVSGDLVQTFIQKTYNVLQSTESFFSKINLYIIQCDAQIQEVVRITKQEEFDEYLKTMKIRGLGGTDFRPVFSYVDQLIADKAFSNLKGLIYFTDGYGTFPEKKPNYESAFVFIDDNYGNPNVPPWAIKLVLQRDEI